MQSSRRFFQLGAALLVLTLWSCGQDQIEEYTAPKTDFSSRPVPTGHEGHSHPHVVETPEWDLPSDWTEQPGSGLRFATLYIDEGDPALELRVTPLALTAGDPLANINRWASQISLPPYEAAELGSVLQEVESHGHRVQIVNLTGPPVDSNPAQQVLAAIILGDQNAWFFMIMGEHERIRPFETDFENFMKTVRLKVVEEEHAASASTEGSAGSAPDHPGSSGEDMTWQLPEHWVQQAGTSEMRVATFTASVGSESAEVTITKFPGDVGGLLPNINRWRRQLGLAGVTSLDDQPLTDVDVAAIPSQFLDLVSDPTATDAQRMYVVIVARSDMTWFIKMSGPANFLETQRTAYDAFVASIGFDGGTPGD